MPAGLELLFKKLFIGHTAILIIQYMSGPTPQIAMALLTEMPYK